MAFAVLFGFEFAHVTFAEEPAHQYGQTLYKQHCAQCHETGAAHAPSPQSLRQIWPEAVFRALSSGGMMQTQGKSLNDDQRRLLARYVTDKEFGAEIPMAPKAAFCKTPETFANPLSGPHWNNWGADEANTRFQPASMAKLPTADIPKLRLKWAFAFPSALGANTPPVVAGGRIFIASSNRVIYSLDAETACIRWAFEASSAVRGAIVLAKPAPDGPWLTYFGDGGGRVYAVAAATGTQVWTARADDLSNLPRITGSLKVYDGMVFVPVTATEELTDANYECCKIPGKVVAFDARTGRQIWATPTISEPAKQTGVNKAGIPTWGPSGAGVWSSPTIDAKRKIIYVGTGDNHSHPTTNTSDSILALDMKTGKILWSRQFTAGDAFNGGAVGCYSLDKRTCPQPHGADADFASPAILVELGNGKRALVAGQKSGVVHAIDPDKQGEVLWETKVAAGGPTGGIEFGIAADRTAVYAPISDVDAREQEPGETAQAGLFIRDHNKGGGLVALDLATGKKIWAAPPILCNPERPMCLPAQTAADTVIPGAVFSGSLDGHMRAYSTKDGSVLWDFDTEREYDAADGLKGHGGSIGGAGPAVADGVLYMTSGDGNTASQPGNVLLAFSVK